jgi:hypothetical protein
MSAFLSHSQQSILRSRVKRADNIRNGRPQSYEMSPGVGAVLDMVIECLNDMHTEGLLIPGYRPEQKKEPQS